MDKDDWTGTPSKVSIVDDDDWTGTPPEGRYSRDRARPEFWRRQWQASVAWAGLALVIIALVIVLLAR